MEYYKDRITEIISYTDLDGKEKEEIWKDIPEYEGIYQVSDLGRIKSLNRLVIATSGEVRKIKGLILKQGVNISGYLTVTLFNKSKKEKKLHRLVMSAFEGISDLDVDHINEIKTDNRKVNLRYATARENTHYYYKNTKSTRSSKYLGVYYNSLENKWVAQIKIEGTTYALGRYTDEKEASDKYQSVLYEYETFNKLPDRIERKFNEDRGVYYIAKSNKWEVKHNDKYIGRYSTKEEAKEVKKRLCGN